MRYRTGTHDHSACSISSHCECSRAASISFRTCSGAATIREWCLFGHIRYSLRCTLWCSLIRNRFRVKHIQAPAPEIYFFCRNNLFPAKVTLEMFSVYLCPFTSYVIRSGMGFSAHYFRERVEISFVRLAGGSVATGQKSFAEWQSLCED